MARLFTSASSQYLENTSAVLTSMPFTMACWFRSSDITTTQTAMALGASGSNDRWALFLAGAQAGDFLQAASVQSGTTTAAATTTGFLADTWHHGCAVFASANSRSIYIDGGSKGSNAGSSTPGTPNRTSIGARNSSGVYGVFMSGRIADAGIWNVALSDAEVAALAKGLHPTRMRPDALVAFWELCGDDSPEPDWHLIGGTRYAMTLANAPTKAAHAPVSPFAVRRWGRVPLIEEAVVTLPFGTNMRGGFDQMRGGFAN
jgi:hypothetical protein